MNKEIFNKHLSTLVEDEFKFSPEWGKWERKQENRTERINISYNEYPGSFYIKGMSVSISFHKVESIFKAHYWDERSEHHKERKTIRDGLNKLPDINYSTLEVEVIDDNSFEIVKEELKKILRFGVFPFFERYNTLEKVFEATEVMPIEEMANFIGQPLPLRRMIIKKLCQDPHYEEYAHMVINYYKSEHNPDGEIAEALHAELSTK